MEKIFIGNIKGTKGDQGTVGPQGKQGIQGVDGENGAGVALGGADGQVLRKKSSSDYDTEWSDMYTNAQIDSKFSDVNSTISNIGIKETFNKDIVNASTSVTTSNDITDDDIWRVGICPRESITEEQIKLYGKFIPMITSATAKTITITCKGGTPSASIPVKVWVEKMH